MKIVWIINFISTFSQFLMTRINISVNWHKADYIHLGRTSLGLQACYLSLKKWSNSIHNASKALPLSSAPESCCAWRCVGSSKLLNCIFHSQGLSAALQQIEFPNIIMITRGKVKRRAKQGYYWQTMRLGVLTSITYLALLIILMPSPNLTDNLVLS